MEDMFVTSLLERARSDNPYDQYLALLMALQVPSICARIEFPVSDENTGKCQDDPRVLYKPNGKAWDKNLYFAWLKKHAHDFSVWHFRLMPFDKMCEAIYQLRNQITHSGEILDADSKIVFVDADCGAMYSGSVLYLSIYDFCKKMFDAARAIPDVSNIWCRDFALLNRIGVRPLSREIYQKLRDESESAYHDFWDGRDDDLQLYQHYCFYANGRIGEIRQRLSEDSEACVFGLSHEGSLHLADVVESVDAFGREMDARIANKYFEKE